MGSNKKKLLLIEDNFDLRENTAELLELAGYEVLTAENGKLGVEMAINQSPNLILCDILMPVLDGYGVLHILNKNEKTKTIPFIFITSKSEKADFRKGMNLGSDDYITKPFKESELLVTIEKRLEKAEQIIKGTNSVFNLDINQNKEKTASLINDFILNYEEVSFIKKSILFKEDSYPKFVYYLNSGKIKLFKTNSFGKELITRIYSSGEIIGTEPILSNGPYSETAEFFEDGSVRSIPTKDFFKFIEDKKEILIFLLQTLSQNLTKTKNNLIDIAYNSVYQRLIRNLLELTILFEENETEDRVSLNLSREELAHLIGTSKETVIRSLSELKTAGLISIKGKYITIISKKELQKKLD